jgi:23S rRNA pseudouridine2605 synthase
LLLGCSNNNSSNSIIIKPYDVKGLDRVMYAGLTKKNVERGKWRFLSEKEIRLLKYMNSSKKK